MVAVVEGDGIAGGSRVRRRGDRTAHVLVTTCEGRIVLQEIAPGLRHEGYWGSSAATYLQAGENFRGAAERALRDELGLVCGALWDHGAVSMLDEEGTKTVGVFTRALGADEKITLNPVSGTALLARAPRRHPADPHAGSRAPVPRLQGCSSGVRTRISGSPPIPRPVFDLLRSEIGLLPKRERSLWCYGRVRHQFFP